MGHLKTNIICIVAFVFVGAIIMPAAFADEKDLGQHSKDEIRNACNAAGGELLGISEQGSYGCEVSSKGTMILCNKSGNCTGYTPALTRTVHNRILDSLHLNSLHLKPKPAAEASCCTGVQSTDKCVAEPQSGGCPADHPIRVLKP